MREFRSVVGKVLLPALLALGLAACSGSDSGNKAPAASSDNPDAVLTKSITVTRSRCTPFGNPPRPRNDELTDAGNQQAVCPSGGVRMADWTDPNGTPRAACLFEPAAAAIGRPLPLLVFLQGARSTIETQLPLTHLLDRLADADLSGDPASPGFILLAPLGRFVAQFYAAGNNTNTVGWDVWYRQLQPDQAARSVNEESFPLNADFAALDHYIAEQVATGKVDSRRIYITGASAGASMALLYGQNRPAVAAVAMYSGPSPYDFLNDPCSQTPVLETPADDTEVQVFNPAIPVYHVVNSCDLYAICPNSVQLRDTLSLGATAGMQHRIIANAVMEQAVDICNAACGTDPSGEYDNTLANTTGFSNHKTWPSGWNDSAFAFLREHPLAAD